MTKFEINGPEWAHHKTGLNTDDDNSWGSERPPVHPEL